MNPYAPPEASVQDRPSKPGSAFKAIALGLVVDVGGSLIAAIILAAIYGATLAATGVPREDIAAAMQASATDSWFFWVGSLVGLSFSVLGGYVCARIARRSEMKFGAIVAALSAVSGFFLGGDQLQLGTNLSMTLLTFGAVLVGARLGLARNTAARRS